LVVPKLSERVKIIIDTYRKEFIGKPVSYPDKATDFLTEIRPIHRFARANAVYFISDYLLLGPKGSLEYAAAYIAPIFPFRRYFLCIVLDEWFFDIFRDLEEVEAFRMNYFTVELEKTVKLGRPLDPETITDITIGSYDSITFLSKEVIEDYISRIEEFYRRAFVEPRKFIAVASVVYYLVEYIRGRYRRFIGKAYPMPAVMLTYPVRESLEKPIKFVERKLKEV